ncbi:MAG: 30S ribosomal protein S12 methylthiotransferase RimO [Oscillospiraceae bacterium]|nr:30S ribosomal protein S12 methylthiotransferase RimO [Oscillospiraceae bacterium]
MGSKIGFISLGCPKNQIDTEIMLKILADNNYEIVVEDIHADIIIVNTCAFIESAKQEAIDNILDVAWLKTNGNKNLKGIIVCGCLAERYREEVLKELPEIDAIVGVFSIHDILEAVKYVENNFVGANMPDKPPSQKGVANAMRLTGVVESDESKGTGTTTPTLRAPPSEKGAYISLKSQNGFVLGGERILTTPEYTAYIKIAEGCDNFCSYCVIPSIRGRFKSRKIGDIVEEAGELADIGVKELCIVAQDTTRYGEDLYGEYKLPELLNKLCEIDKIKWIRLLYCYPDKITDELINTIKNQDKILKYIDMPVQHINDKILKSMNRRGGSEAIKSAVKRLRENIPDIAIRTTVIVGFPGETKEIFGELCEFIREIKFERLGSFMYSPEEGTPAAGFENQVSQKEKERRQKSIMSIQERINGSLNQKKIGKTIKVLCEGFDKVGEVYFGRSEADAPEIDGKIYFAAAQGIQNTPQEGDFVDVKITKVLDYDLYGECVK